MSFVIRYLQTLPKQQVNGMLNVKTINKFDHAPFISSVDHWPFPRWNVNKLYILSTFGNISLPFHEVHLKEGQPWTTLLNHEQLFDVNQNLLARALKIYFHRLLFFYSPYIEQPRNFLLSQKQLYIPLLFPSHVFNWALTDWLIFKGEQIWFFFFFFLISHSTLRKTVNSVRC